MEAATAQAPLAGLAGNPFGDRLAVKVSRVAEVFDCSDSQIYAMVKDGRLEKLDDFGKGEKKSAIRVTVASIFKLLNGEADAKTDAGPNPAVRAANAQARGRVHSCLRG